MKHLFDLSSKVLEALEDIKLNILAAQPAYAGMVPDELYKAACSGPGRNCVGCSGGCAGRCGSNCGHDCSGRAK